MSTLTPFLNVFKDAFLIFPLVALVITLPYLIYYYKKFGAVTVLRSLVVYSFVLYIINVYFLVVLPLPPREVVAAMTSPKYELVPFHSVQVFLERSGFRLHDTSTWWPALKGAYSTTVLFNIAMFFPLGIYLRYYFRCKLGKTVLISFLGSLFCELTQLSALYGIYPRPYRLFETDDLITNTLGGLIGFCIAPIFIFFLPSRDKMDDHSRKTGQTVPILRRLLAVGVDWVVLFLLFWGLEKLFPALQAQSDFTDVLHTLIAMSYFILWVYLWRGKTPGKAFFRMRLVSNDGSRPTFWQCVVRYGLLYGVLFSLPDLALYFFDLGLNASYEVEWKWMVPAVVFGVLSILFLLEAILRLFGSNKRFLYGRISKTYNQNLIGRNKHSTEPVQPKPESDLDAEVLEEQPVGVRKQVVRQGKGSEEMNDDETF